MCSSLWGFRDDLLGMCTCIHIYIYICICMYMGYEPLGCAHEVRV